MLKAQNLVQETAQLTQVAKLPQAQKPKSSWRSWRSKEKRKKKGRRKSRWSKRSDRERRRSKRSNGKKSSKKNRKQIQELKEPLKTALVHLVIWQVAQAKALMRAWETAMIKIWHQLERQRRNRSNRTHLATLQRVK